jgi:hypothetical protein
MKLRRRGGGWRWPKGISLAKMRKSKFLETICTGWSLHCFMALSSQLDHFLAYCMCTEEVDSNRLSQLNCVAMDDTAAPHCLSYTHLTSHCKTVQYGYTVCQSSDGLDYTAVENDRFNYSTVGVISQRLSNASSPGGKSRI